MGWRSLIFCIQSFQHELDFIPEGPSSLHEWPEAKTRNCPNVFTVETVSRVAFKSSDFYFWKFVLVIIVHCNRQKDLER